MEGDLDEFHVEQNKDPELKSLRHFLEYGILPTDEKEARKMAAQALNFVIIDKILYFVDSKGGGRKRGCCSNSLAKDPTGRSSQGEDGWTLLGSSHLRSAESSMVVAHDVHGCSGVQ